MSGRLWPAALAPYTFRLHMGSLTHELGIRRATASDAALVAELGRRTFTDTFASDNTPEDMAAFLAATFGPELQRRETEDPAVAVLLAERAGSPVAYAMLREGEAPEGVTGPAPIELARFYVDRSGHGQGIAARLMACVLETAAARGARTLWLGVWERNARAIAFYRKQGFEDVGSHAFVLGSDIQTDRLMQRPIPVPAR